MEIFCGLNWLSTNPALNYWVEESVTAITILHYAACSYYTIRIAYAMRRNPDAVSKDTLKVTRNILIGIRFLFTRPS